MDINALLPVLTTAIVVLGGLTAALGFRRKDAADASNTAKTNVETMAVIAAELRTELSECRTELAACSTEITQLRGRIADLEAQLLEAKNARRPDD